MVPPLVSATPGVGRAIRDLTSLSVPVRAGRPCRPLGLPRREASLLTPWRGLPPGPLTLSAQGWVAGGSPHPLLPAFLPCPPYSSLLCRPGFLGNSLRSGGADLGPLAPCPRLPDILATGLWIIPIDCQLYQLSPACAGRAPPPRDHAPCEVPPITVLGSRWPRSCLLSAGGQPGAQPHLLWLLQLQRAAAAHAHSAGHHRLRAGPHGHAAGLRGPRR